MSLIPESSQKHAMFRLSILAKSPLCRLTLITYAIICKCIFNVRSSWERLNVRSSWEGILRNNSSAIQFIVQATQIGNNLAFDFMYKQTSNIITCFIAVKLCNLKITGLSLPLHFKTKNQLFVFCTALPLTPTKVYFYDCNQNSNSCFRLWPMVILFAIDTSIFGS